MIGTFRGMPDALARSILGNTLDPLELGKINSLIGTIQALSALAGAPFYSWIYVKTLTTRPATFLDVNSLILLIEVVLFG